MANGSRALNGMECTITFSSNKHSVLLLSVFFCSFSFRFLFSLYFHLQFVCFFLYLSLSFGMRFFCITLPIFLCTKWEKNFMYNGAKLSLNSDTHSHNDRTSNNSASSTFLYRHTYICLRRCVCEE